MKHLSLLACILIVSGVCYSQSPISSADFFVQSEKNIRIFVREIIPPKATGKEKCILLIHGGFGALTSFDLDVPGGSFARDLAAQGFHVFLMDMRGWETSTFPDTTTHTLSLTSGVEAVKDMDAVVKSIKKRCATKSVALFGWATGGHWAAYYTTQHNANVSHLITLNSLYGVNAPWSLRKSFSDPADSTRYNEQGMGRFRRSSRQSLIRTLNNSIPSSDKSAWRDSVVTNTCAATATSFARDGMFTTPGDFRRESFYMSLGKKYWNAEDIRVPVLLMRGAHDFWSRPQDIDAFHEDLKNAPHKKKLTIAEGTHFIFLDRPDKGRDMLLSEITAFLSH